MFTRPHGVHVAPDDTIWLTDDGDHTVRHCTLDGKVLMTLGIPGKPAPFMSGDPFHRCTHTALSPQCDDLYVSDGYGNARVHKYTIDGKLQKSWGEPGTDPAQFNIAHNICCDPDGWVYVADRENHRVQVFDGDGKWETQWNNLHRPYGLCRCGGKEPLCIIGELGARRRDQPRLAEYRAAGLDRRARRATLARLGGAHGPGLRGRPVHLAARHRGRFARQHLCRRSWRHRLEDQLSGYADAAGASGQPLPAEAGEDSGIGAPEDQERRSHRGCRRSQKSRRSPPACVVRILRHSGASHALR